MDDSKATFFSSRSSCYASLNKWAESTEDGLQCIIKDSSFVWGYYHAALGLKNLKRLDEASVVVKRGLAVDPKNDDLKKLNGEIDKERGYYFGVHKNYIAGGAAALVAGAALPVVAPVCLTMAGFSSTGKSILHYEFHRNNITGIVAGSFAAASQAAVGNVVAGSWIAVCTSWGMTGATSAAACVTAGAVTGTAVAGTLNGVSILSKNNGV